MQARPARLDRSEAHTPWGATDAWLACALLALVWGVHGAVPALAIPTVSQLIWTQGFAQSLANQGWLTLRAVEFGWPEPAGIAFGLSGVWPSAVFIRLVAIA